MDDWDDWTEQAACRGAGTDLFFSSDPDLQHAARKVCMRCDVQRQCAQAAVDMPQFGDGGVWGGLTEGQRRRVRSGAVPLDVALDRAARRVAAGERARRRKARRQARPSPQRRQQDRQAQWEAAVQAVCDVTGLTIDELCAPSRALEGVEGRRILYVLLRERGWSLPEIGRKVGRDHTTVLHALRTFDPAADQGTAAQLDRVRSELTEAS